MDVVDDRGGQLGGGVAAERLAADGHAGEFDRRHLTGELVGGVPLEGVAVDRHVAGVGEHVGGDLEVGVDLGLHGLGLGVDQVVGAGGEVGDLGASAGLLGLGGGGVESGVSPHRHADRRGGGEQGGAQTEGDHLAVETEAAPPTWCGAFGHGANFRS